MKIQNEFKNRFIEIIVDEFIKENYPSYRVRVDIETENIQTGFNKHIWISQKDLERFIKDLDEFEKNKKGQVEIKSMSSEEFMLYFKALDNSGHLAVGINLRKEDRMTKDYSFDLKVEFQIDPTIIFTVITDFKRILQ